ncbi:hypothetical protein BLOT_010055, partial [Blomia tropicalis]
MPSSYPKHHCLHRLLLFIAASLVVASFIVIMRKDCRVLPIEDDSSLWSQMVNNRSMQVHYIEHYYDDVQIYHIVIFTIDVIVFLMAFLNVAPSQEDIRFGFHLLMAINKIAEYNNNNKKYERKDVVLGEKWTEERQVYQHSQSGKGQGKGAPINAYVEQDYQLLTVTLLDAGTFTFLLISTIVLCFDAREEAIQDEYVARKKRFPISCFWHSNLAIVFVVSSHNY